MKKLIVLHVLFFTFLLASCTNETSKEEGRNDNETIQNEEKVSESQTSNEEKIEEAQDDKETFGNINKVEETKEAQYKISESWSIVPLHDGVNDKVVLLTIDDAPDNYALDMAKTLYAMDANAIFFVNGHFLETEEEKSILKQIYDMGFIIGNHTYSHENLSKIEKNRQREEIVKVNDIVEEITGERPLFFRAPFGVNTDYSKQVVQEEGMALMNWSYGYDWEKEYMSKDAIADIMVHTELLHSGANLLMHDREWTSLALRDIVTGLRNKEYEIVNPALIQTNE